MFVLLAVFLQKLLNEMKFRSHIFSAIFILGAFLCSQAQVVNSINQDNIKKNLPKAQKTATTKAPLPVDPNVKIDTTTTYFRMVDTAQAYVRQKDWTKAEAYLRKALAAEPTNPNNSLLISNLATLQRYQGKLADAIKNYTLAIDMTPNAVTVLGNRAALYLQVDSIALAQADYEHIIAIDPSDEESRYNLGMILLDQRKYQAADDQFEEILRYHPESTLAAEGKAFLYKAKGNYYKAADYFSDVIKSRPTASLHANRADCYLMLKRLNDAANDINSALQVTPDDGYLYLLRAKLNKLRYESDAAKRDVKLAIEHGVDPQIANKVIK